MILKISVRLLKHLTSRRMTLLLGRPDSEKSTLLLALADKNLKYWTLFLTPWCPPPPLAIRFNNATSFEKLTEFAKPKPTELFRVSSVRPTTCLGEHQQTATWHTWWGKCSHEHNQRPFTEGSTCNVLTLRLERYRSVLATSINPKIFGGCKLYYV